MSDAGILEVNQMGTERYYRASMDATLTLLKDLTAVLEIDITVIKMNVYTSKS